MALQGSGRVILASSSPRRRELLSLLGLEFSVVPAQIEERIIGDPVTTARQLAYAKALRVWKENKDALVIGADTLVHVGKKILGKPRNEEEAFRMLSLLSGRWHRVVTAVSVVGPCIRRIFHDTARVKFRKLSEEEIRFYISTEEPMDKAGAYGVQGFGATLVERIEGSFYTVMGLPVSRLYDVLKGLSIVRFEIPSPPR